MKKLLCVCVVLSITSVVIGLRGQGSFNTPGPPPVEWLLTGSLSSAQILALNSTPVTVIPAQGAGTVIIIDQFSAELVFNSVAYTNTGSLGLRWNNSLSGQSLSANCAAAFLTASANDICIATSSTILGTASTFFVNQPVTFSINSAPTLGNSPVNYWISYHVLVGF
jgi:hypothetical protein